MLGGQPAGGGGQEVGKGKRRCGVGGGGVWVRFLSLFCPTRFERGSGNRGPAVPLCCWGFRRLRCCELRGGCSSIRRSAFGFLYFILYIFSFFFFPLPTPPRFPSAFFPLLSSPDGRMLPTSMGESVEKVCKSAVARVICTPLYTRPALCTHYTTLTSFARPRLPPSRSVLQPAPSHWGPRSISSARLLCF